MKKTLEGQTVDVCESCTEPAGEDSPLLWLHSPLGFKTSWAFHENCLISFHTNLRTILGLAPYPGNI